MKFLKVDNPVCRVNFAGFQSDTLALQKAGWQLSFETDPYRCAIRMAMRHEGARLQAISAPVNYDQIHAYHVGSMAPDFNIVHVGHDLRFELIPMRSIGAFHAADAVPAYREVEHVSFEDMIPFRPISTEAPEIVVDQKTVAELMDIILAKQDPAQKEIRERRRKDAWRNHVGERVTDSFGGYQPARDIRAQIVSLAV